MAVVIPCYNVERYLERALESVLAQTYRDLCFYAVDDGSTDGTAQILRKYSRRGVCTYQAHCGPAAARNRGIRMSQSPFVAFLDADDEWLPNKLEHQVACLKRDPLIGLICSGCASSEGGRFGPSFVGTGNLPPQGRLFEQLVRDCFVTTPTVVVRRECLEQVGLFDESLLVSEDFNLWLRIAAQWKIAFVPEILAIRHTRPDSLSLSADAEVRLRNGVAALEKLASACAELSPREREAMKQALAVRIYRYGSYLLSIGECSASRGELLSAWTARPSNIRALVKLFLSFLPLRVFRSLLETNRELRNRLRSRHSARI
ncbi:MAG: glycosyltransferase family A protein [Candidatus Acidiferrum sp.]